MGGIGRRSFRLQWTSGFGKILRQNRSTDAIRVSANPLRDFKARKRTAGLFHYGAARAWASIVWVLTSCHVETLR